MNTVTDNGAVEPRHAADLVTALRAADLHDLADALDVTFPPQVTLVAERDLPPCEFCPTDGEFDRHDPVVDLVVTWGDGHESREPLCPTCIPVARHWHTRDWRVQSLALELPAGPTLTAQLAPAFGAAA